MLSNCERPVSLLAEVPGGFVVSAATIETIPDLVAAGAELGVSGYLIREVTDLPPYVLRFWETEFKKIHPKRTSSGQRLYRKKDVERIIIIKDLLYNQRFTIQGARQYLKSSASKRKSKTAVPTLAEIRKELESIRDLLI